MIWGGPEEKSEMDLFFPREFFPGEGPPRFFFLYFLRASPQIINGRSLIKNVWTKALAHYLNELFPS